MLRQAVHNSPQICQFGGLQLRAVMALTRWMAKVSGGGVVQVLCWGLGLPNDPDKAADMQMTLVLGTRVSLQHHRWMASVQLELEK